jgi:flagellar biosynthesis GTPase FlhF
MSEENQVVEQVQVDPVEQEARASGWVPKEEFHGDEHKWVDAGEFVRRAPLFQKIDTAGREIKELRKSLDALKQHHAQVRETEYKRALDELKASKREAYIEGDPDALIEIDEKLAAVKDAQARFKQEQAQEAARAADPEVIHPEFAAWTKRNTWYNESKPMRAFADALGIELRAQGISPSDVLRQVEVKIKEEFPNKFRNPNRDKPGAVEGGGKAAPSKGNSGEASLSDEERRIMNTFVRTGVMTKEQYIADLKKVKGE